MKVDEEADAGLTGALHMWLFEYFLAETIICLTPSKVVLLVSKAKGVCVCVCVCLPPFPHTFV